MQWRKSTSKKPEKYQSYFVLYDYGVKDVMRLETLLKWIDDHPENHLWWLDMEDDNPCQKKAPKRKRIKVVETIQKTVSFSFLPWWRLSS